MGVMLVGLLMAPSSSAGLLSGAPVNLTPPLITGTPQVGQQLTCSNGTWTNSPTSYSYGWQLNGTTISGATNSTYAPVNGDVGGQVTCTVTATNASGSSSPATSLPVIILADPLAGVPVNLTPPLITGTPQVGQQLTCSNGTWTTSATSYAYSWQLNGTTIGGATNSTYTPVNGDVGGQVTCTVVATNASGSSAPATSLPVIILALPLAGVAANLTPPLITGTPQVGQQLTCSNGTWTNSPTSYAYSWQLNGTTIGGATNSTYTAISGDAEGLITCAVTATNSSGSSAPTTSLPLLILAALTGGGTSGSTSIPTSGTSTGSATTTGPYKTGPSSPSPAAKTGGSATAPVVSGFGLTRRRFAVGASPTALVAARRRTKHKAKVAAGTAFRFLLSQPAWVQIAIRRSVAGVKRHGRCVKLSGRRSARTRNGCSVLVAVGTLTRAEARTDRISIAFSGRLGSKVLSRGHYSATIVAVNASRLSSRPQSATFTVIGASVRRT